MLVTKSLEWIAMPGLTRERIIEDITRDAVAHRDMGTHVWVAMINNLGSMLYCFAVQLGAFDHHGREVGVYYVKRIPEAAGPDVYDCPQEIMEMCRITNPEWRARCNARDADAT
jgi:hypothetical protein